MVNRHPVTCRAQARASMLVSSRDVATSGRAHALRRKAGKPTLPVWFVYFGKGKAQAETHAAAAKSYRNMGVTYSTVGEYKNGSDLLRPTSAA
jgi:hypothetical protein